MIPDQMLVFPEVQDVNDSLPQIVSTEEQEPQATSVQSSIEAELVPERVQQDLIKEQQPVNYDHYVSMQMQIDGHGTVHTQTDFSHGDGPYMQHMLPPNCEIWTFMVMGCMRNLEMHLSKATSTSIQRSMFVRRGIERLDMLMATLYDILEDTPSEQDHQNVFQRFQQQRKRGLQQSFNAWFKDPSVRRVSIVHVRKQRKQIKRLSQLVEASDSSEIAQAFQQLHKEWKQFQTLLPREQQGMSGTMRHSVIQKNN